jgi:hypothetical protein
LVVEWRKVEMAGKRGLNVKVEHRLVLFAVVGLLVVELLLLTVAFGKVVTVASVRTVVVKRFVEVA